MKITVTQNLVDAIVARAKASDCGLGNPEKGPKSYDISQYAPQSLHTLAVMLVSAHFSKWDIISVMTAALEEVTERMHKASLGTVEAVIDATLTDYSLHCSGCEHRKNVKIATRAARDDRTL